MSIEGFENILPYFVGPAIIAAIITGLFSLTVSRRSAKMENVIQERSKWRAKIREISESIQSQDIPKLQKALKQLKLYINTYGLIGDADNKIITAEQIRRDLHIWILIRGLEESIETTEKKNLNNKDRKEEQLKEECELLITYLSFLLKYDWERSKNEINRSISSILGWLLMFAGMISILFISPIYSPDLTAIQVIVAIIYIFLVLLISYVLERLMAERILNYAASYKMVGLSKRKKNLEDLIWGYIPFELYDVYSWAARTSMLIIASLCWFVVDNVEVSWKSISVEGMLVSVTVYILGAYIHAYEKKKTLKSEYNYISGINLFAYQFYNKK